MRALMENSFDWSLAFKMSTKKKMVVSLITLSWSELQSFWFSHFTSVWIQTSVLFALLCEEERTMLIHLQPNVLFDSVYKCLIPVTSAAVNLKLKLRNNSFCLTLRLSSFFFSFTVPETLDRKHFHQKGMCAHTSSVKGPPQVCARWTAVLSPDGHGNGGNCMVCVVK